MSGLDLRFAPPGIPDNAPLVAPSSTVREKARVFVAWCLLAVTDVALRIGGFHRFYRMMERWPVRRAPSPERRAAVVTDGCTAVLRARPYYFKHAWCLQRSAAAVCLLRMRGVPADLVIGVRKIPFYAHAWAEVDGEVVNDQATVRTLYPEIVRC